MKSKKEWTKWAGNQSRRNLREREIVPTRLMHAMTESVDSVDGDGTPVISDENVLQAKDFVDNEKKL